MLPATSTPVASQPHRGAHGTVNGGAHGTVNGGAHGTAGRRTTEPSILDCPHADLGRLLERPAKHGVQLSRHAATRKRRSAAVGPEAGEIQRRVREGKRLARTSRRVRPDTRQHAAAGRSGGTQIAHAGQCRRVVRRRWPSGSPGWRRRWGARSLGRDLRLGCPRFKARLDR
jgi:hypothetical protein